MSRRKAQLRGLAPQASAGDGSFTRGFVAAACVSSFQDGVRFNPQRMLRHGLQGGAALTAGSHAVQALREQRPWGALAAVAAGTVAVYLIENLLGEQAAHHHQEEAQDGQEGQEA